MLTRKNIHSIKKNTKHKQRKSKKNKRTKLSKMKGSGLTNRIPKPPGKQLLKEQLSFIKSILYAESQNPYTKTDKLINLLRDIDKQIEKSINDSSTSILIDNNPDTNEPIMKELISIYARPLFNNIFYGPNKSIHIENEIRNFRRVVSPRLTRLKIALKDKRQLDIDDIISPTERKKRRLQDEIGELNNEDLDNYVNVFA